MLAETRAEKPQRWEKGQPVWGSLTLEVGPVYQGTESNGDKSGDFWGGGVGDFIGQRKRVLLGKTDRLKGGFLHLRNPGGSFKEAK